MRRRGEARAVAAVLVRGWSRQSVFLLPLLDKNGVRDCRRTTGPVIFANFEKLASTLLDQREQRLLRKHVHLHVPRVNEAIEILLRDEIVVETVGRNLKVADTVLPQLF